MGRQSSVKTFRITGTPSDDGYLLLTYAYAKGAGHIIQLNDRDLPWVDLFPSTEPSTHLKPIESQFLMPGLNTLQIVLNGPALLVYYAVVHWRALDYGLSYRRSIPKMVPSLAHPELGRGLAYPERSAHPAKLFEFGFDPL